MQVRDGLIMLAAYFCQSPLIKGRVYLTTMNVKLLAASDLLVQIGTFFAIVQC